MNFLRSPFASSVFSVKSLLISNVTKSGGVLPKPVMDSGCIYANGLASRSYGTLRSLLPNAAPSSTFGGLPSMTSLLCRPLLVNSDLTGSSAVNSQITPGSFYIQSRGLKYKGKVKRRCRDCFITWINGLCYNLCKTHPRHKHVLKQPYFINQRILTHATQCPKRPW